MATVSVAGTGAGGGLVSRWRFQRERALWAPGRGGSRDVVVPGAALFVEESGPRTRRGELREVLYEHVLV